MSWEFSAIFASDSDKVLQAQVPAHRLTDTYRLHSSHTPTTQLQYTSYRRATCKTAGVPPTCSVDTTFPHCTHTHTHHKLACNTHPQRLMLCKHAWCISHTCFVCTSDHISITHTHTHTLTRRLWGSCPVKILLREKCSILPRGHIPHQAAQGLQQGTFITANEHYMPN